MHVMPCTNFKDSACPAELVVQLVEQSRQNVAGSSLTRGSSSFSLGKKELSSGVVACICLVSITDLYMYL